MKVVSVGELPLQRFGKGSANCGFAGTGHTHQEYDHRSVGSHTL
jgi:hypothetical protein